MGRTVRHHGNAQYLFGVAVSLSGVEEVNPHIYGLFQGSAIGRRIFRAINAAQAITTQADLGNFKIMVLAVTHYYFSMDSARKSCRPTYPEVLFQIDVIII